MADEFIAVVKADCPTCQLIVPVLHDVAGARHLVIHPQDDPAFPPGVPGVAHDGSLELSYRLAIDTVPTLVRMRDGVEIDRTIGWSRAAWRRLTGLPGLGAGLPDFKPGCGALNVLPGVPERLALRFGDVPITSRSVDVSELDDPIEVAYDRGWSDGLPVTPPTPLRVARMLGNSSRSADEVLGAIPPNLATCTVEKAAINAVLAGCRPSYFPVVLTAIEAALLPAFAMHGLLCTLHFSGPVVVVGGPVTTRIGMNSGGNALGQGNRANATIGRALQLVVRNVGGGRPGEIDRAILGNPGKYSFCFAEDTSDPAWLPFHESLGCAPGSSGVSLFHGEGVHGFTDKASRTAPELASSLALALWSVTHPKYAAAENGGALVVISPNHYDIFRSAGWTRGDVHEAVWEALRRPASEVARGVGGVPTGVDPDLGDTLIDKFHPENLQFVRAGGRGGLHSAIVGGWTGRRNPREITTVTKEISE